MNEMEWEKLLKGVNEITQWHKEGLLFIGGVAVYFHAREFDKLNYLSNSLVELSHDADFMISVPEFADLRDLEEVTNNSRLSKGQLVKHGIEYDIYVQSTHNLCVSFEDALQKRKEIEGIPVASLDHLLGLKMMAYEDRKKSIKGEKDRRDIVKIVAMNSAPDKEAICQVIPYVDIDVLKQISTSSAFSDICEGNFHQAKSLRELYSRNLSNIEHAMNVDCSRQVSKLKGPGL
ncbi:hypothetical protein CL689_06425 [Candidatus Saccharibacteria bacterium]|nr:hypothetical protein [Candidatus Saccharibacteria bacterium]|tara:strand:- start:2940 stop:3638 length:699 start_codon:yes stop_codon:yes gene_type:complete